MNSGKYERYVIIINGGKEGFRGLGLGLELELRVRVTIRVIAQVSKRPPGSLISLSLLFSSLNSAFVPLFLFWPTFFFQDARAAIHEAMEQQTLSVAKAGLVCKLNARTTVFAVATPRGQYDMDEDITVNTAIGSPLLSRFDLILLLLDNKNEEWDRVVSTFILRSAMLNKKEDGRPCGPEHNSTGAATTIKPPPPIPQKAWPVEKLQKYLAWVRERHPKVTLSSEVEEILCTYYECQRQSKNRSAARTTVRLLESLVRLAQAHARLMNRSTAILQDAIASVMCLEMSVASSSLLGMRNSMHSDFPEDPDGDFRVKQRLLLDKLGLVELG